MHKGFGVAGQFREGGNPNGADEVFTATVSSNRYLTTSQALFAVLLTLCIKAPLASRWRTF